MLNLKLKDLRKSKGVTQQDVANFLSISRVAYARYEIGDRQPTYETLVKLSDYFDVDFNFLLNNEIKKFPVQTTDDVYHFPIRVIGEGSCGLGCNNEDYVTTETFDIPNAWISGSFNDYFIVIAKGDSMIDAHIANNSLNLFKRQEMLENNQIGAFSLNGEDYIKRFKRYNSGMIVLQSANNEYEDIEVTENDDFRIIGVLKKTVISR